MVVKLPPSKPPNASSHKGTPHIRRTQEERIRALVNPLWSRRIGKNLPRGAKAESKGYHVNLMVDRMGEAQNSVKRKRVINGEKRPRN